jgi:TolB protein
MKRSPRKWSVDAVAACVAAALTVISLGGCSMTMTVTPPPPAAATAEVVKKPIYLPDSVIDSGPAAPTKPPSVNVFGEFTRTRTGPAMLVGDPSLRQQTFPESGYDADVCVSPDGRWIVYIGSRDGAGTQLFRQKIGESSAVALTSGDGDSAQPTISPDGRQIAFCSNRSGAWHIYVMSADGRNVTPLTDGDTNDMHPSFSPDGRRLVFSSMQAAGEPWVISVIDIASRRAQVVGKGLFPAWSPRADADVIAFQKTRARGSRWFSLWTCELRTNEAGDTEAAEVTEIAVSANSALIGPAWSVDGKQLAFSSIVDPAQMKNGKPQGQQDVWVMEAIAGANKRRLTDGVGTNLAPCWAVDNRVYFVSDRTGHESVWSLPATVISQRSATSEGSTAATDSSEVKP